MCSWTETQPPSAEMDSLEVVRLLILEQAPLKIDLGWIRGLLFSVQGEGKPEREELVTEKALGLGGGALGN